MNSPATELIPLSPAPMPPVDLDNAAIVNYAAALANVPTPRLSTPSQRRDLQAMQEHLLEPLIASLIRYARQPKN